MKLLQFSTSHYCRKVRLALGYKGLAYGVENLEPGFHVLKIRPLTGLNTVPTLVTPDHGAIADSTAILDYLEHHYPQPSWTLADPEKEQQARLWEDWLDESIGTAVRYVYYQGRSQRGGLTMANRLLIRMVKQKYGIHPGSVTQAETRIQFALETLGIWQHQRFLLGQFSRADLTAAALLSPLAIVPHYRDRYPWLFTKIREIHGLCAEPLPPGFSEDLG